MRRSGSKGDEKMNSAWAAGGSLGLPAVGYAYGLRFRRLYPGPLQRYAFTHSGSPLRFNTLGTTYSGWFLGSGYEYRFDMLPGLYWRTEYRFNSLQQQG